MTIKRIKEKYLYVYLIVILNFLGLSYNPEQAYNLVRILGVIVLLTALFFSNKKSSDSFSTFVKFFIGYVVLEIFVSSFHYGTPIDIMFLFSISYATILSYFVFYKIERERLVKIVCWMSSITIGILTVQYFIYRYLGIEFLFKFSEIPTRMEVQRIYIGIYIFPFAFLISLSRIITSINNKTKIPPLYLITAGLTLFDLYFFVMTRSFLILILAVALLIVLFFLRGRKKIYFILSCVILFYAGYALGFFDKYIEFSKSEDVSLSTRFAAIDYYYNITINENPLLGFGFIKIDNNQLKGILQGANGEFYREDVGIFGFFNNFGLIGLTWLCLLIYRMTKIVIRKFKDKSLYQYPEFLAILLMFILCELTSINLINYDGIASFVIVLLLLNDHYPKVAKKSSSEYAFNLKQS